VACILCLSCEQGLIPVISAGEIAAEEPVLDENVAEEQEDGELVSSPSQHKDLDVMDEDTRTTKIRRIVYVRASQNVMDHIVHSSFDRLSDVVILCFASPRQLQAIAKYWFWFIRVCITH